MLRLDNRVAIVTGAGRGIGRAYALLLAERGAAVIVNDLGTGLDGTGVSRTPADEVVAEIEAHGGRAVANHSSVSAPDGPASIVRAALDHFGRIDIVINNAGLEGPIRFSEATLDSFHKLMNVHFFGTVGVTLAAWPHLIASGAGRVINTTSTAIYGLDVHTAYGAAKGAILAFSRNLAIEGEADGIKVNCIAPMAGTRMAEVSGSPQSVQHYMREHMPPSLVAPAAIFLAHETCPFTGETFCIGGGVIRRITICENQGYQNPALTSELIVENLASVTDETSNKPVARIIFPA